MSTVKSFEDLTVWKDARKFTNKIYNLTNAAILLFAKNPQDFFIQSGIKAIRFKGTATPF